MRLPFCLLDIYIYIYLGHYTFLAELYLLTFEHIYIYASSWACYGRTLSFCLKKFCFFLPLCIYVYKLGYKGDMEHLMLLIITFDSFLFCWVSQQLKCTPIDFFAPSFLRAWAFSHFSYLFFPPWHHSFFWLKHQLSRCLTAIIDIYTSSSVLAERVYITHDNPKCYLLFILSSPKSCWTEHKKKKKKRER